MGTLSARINRSFEDCREGRQVARDQVYEGDGTWIDFVGGKQGSVVSRFEASSINNHTNSASDVTVCAHTGYTFRSLTYRFFATSFALPLLTKNQIDGIESTSFLAGSAPI
jgi:hypothetical protein